MVGSWNDREKRIPILRLPTFVTHKKDEKDENEKKVSLRETHTPKQKYFGSGLARSSGSAPAPVELQAPAPV